MIVRHGGASSSARRSGARPARRPAPPPRAPAPETGEGEHPAREQLMRGDPERPDVRGRADRDPLRSDPLVPPFRRQEVRCAQARGVRVRAVELAGEPEIGDPRRAVLHEQDVARLQVAVHPAQRVDVDERLADLAQDAGGVRDRLGRRPRREQVLQADRGALHREHDGAVQRGLPRIVDDERLEGPDQAWMIGLLVEAHLLADLGDVGALCGREARARQELQRAARALGRIVRPARPLHPARGVDARPRS